MTIGRIAAAAILLAAVLAAVLIYYSQIHGFYEPVQLSDGSDTVRIQLVSADTGRPEPIPAGDFRGIDADSSPLRFRGCFTTPSPLTALAETFVIKDDAEPLIAPGWFDCFDAKAIGKALEEGEAIAFLGQRNIRDGVDRVVAVFPDGRAYIWHQLNEKYRN
ncbi:MAG: DUF6446 family protein [Pseudomonadota bacterium]